MLVVNKHYLPGFRAGGPIRSLSAMVNTVDGLRWRIVARDRDFGDRDPYAGILKGGWNRVGGADVLYISPGIAGLPRLVRELARSSYDVVYFNSALSPFYSVIPLLLRRFRLLPCRAAVIAPRGEFSAGARSIRSRKKQIFLAVASAVDLYRGVVWHATNEAEAAEIRKTVGDTVSLVVASNLSLAGGAGSGTERRRRPKQPGRLRVAFVSRITAKKNLTFALECLRVARGEVEFDIYGAVTDPQHWLACVRLIEEMPSNIVVRYHGDLPHELVDAALMKAELFFLPTLGENYGHAIVEAFAAGTPVLISDMTPWRELMSKGVGWDLPLADRQAFADALNAAVNMGPSEFASMSVRALRYAEMILDRTELVGRYKHMFSLAADLSSGMAQHG